MKIDGDTIKFKSESYYYDIEQRGLKPNTLRVLNKKEGIDVNKWSAGNPLYIEISVNAELGSIAAFTLSTPFKKNLVWLGKVGDFLGKEIWMFCWEHEDMEGVKK